MGAEKKRTIQGRLSVFVLLAVLLLSIASPVLAADDDAQRTVVINAKDWRAQYLVSAYSHFTGAKFVFFTSLTDSQLKTKMLGKSSQIMVFESEQDPVIKNYASFLRVNGYENFDSYEYESLEKLQEYLDKQIDANGYFVITSDFGLDAVTGAPLIADENLLPLFLTQDSLKFVQSKTSQKDSYIVGRAPVRMLDKLEGTKIQGFPQSTMDLVSEEVMTRLDNPQWGLIMKIDTVDLSTLWKGYPIFVFYADEYLDELTQTIKDSNIVKFEVIGAGTADIAKSIEIKSQRNLNFMLKYGRKVTNYAGLEDKILDLDSIAFNYPQERLEILATTYYESLNILAVTFENQGNVPLLFFSNLEIADQPLSDANTHAIAPGETKTIPFLLRDKPSDLEVIVTTRYGASLPLKFAISGESGTLFYSATAQTGPFAEEQAVEVLRSGFDTQLGVLEIDVKNPYGVPIKVFLELVINDSDVIASQVIELGPRDKGTLYLEAPYIPNENILGQEFDLISYVGTHDTIVTTVTPHTIRKKTSNGLLGFVIGDDASTAVQILAVIVLVLIIIFLYFLFFVARKKRKKDSKKAAKTSKKASKKKQTTKKKTSSKKKGRSHMKK